MRAALRILVICLVAAALALATLPYWMGVALPLVGPALHLHVGHYARDGYGRFVARDVVYARGPVRITIASAELDSPVLWGLRHLRHADRRISARGWEVVVTPTGEPAVHTGPVGMDNLHGRLEKIAATLQRWLPQADVHDGGVSWPKGGFRLADADWQQRTLTVRGLKYGLGVGSGVIRFDGPADIRVDASEPDRRWRASLVWNGPKVVGKAWEWEQAIDVSGEYGVSGWLPEHAIAAADSWALTAQQLGLQGGYGPLTGRARAEWKDGSYSLTAHVRAAPLSGPSAKLPELVIDAEAKGGRTQWSVEALKVEAPYAVVRLDHPVDFSFGARPAFTHATLDVTANLGRLPGGHGRGTVSGVITADGATGHLPTIAWNVKGDQVAWEGVPSGSFASSGSCDFQERLLKDVSARGVWEGASLEGWLPAAVKADRIELNLQAHGPWAAVVHRGTARAENVRLGTVKPATVTADWQGAGLAVSQVHVAAEFGDARAEVSGTADRNGATLAHVRLARGRRGAESSELISAAPIQLTWQPRLHATRVELRGGASAVVVDLWAEPDFAAQLTEFSSDWIRAFVPLAGPDFMVHRGSLTGRWEQGRLRFNVAVDCALRLPPGEAQVVIDASGDSRGVQIRSLSLQAQGHPLATATAQLPVSWRRQPRIELETDVNAPLRLRLESDPESPFWAPLAERFGLQLSRPQAAITVTGSLSDPKADILVRCDRLGAAPRAKPLKVPTLDHLTVDAHADSAALTLSSLGGSIAGQPLMAKGRLPMGRAGWIGLFQRRSLPDWKQAQGEFEIARAEISALQPYLPSVIAAFGHLSVHLKLAGGRTDGTVDIDGMALKPIDPLGRIQAIGGRAVWRNGDVDLTGLTGEIGGQKVTVTGLVNFPRGGSPHWLVEVKGESIPLVRRANVLVRADLDLKAATEADGTEVSGKVTVRDALFLGELGDFVHTGLTGAARPPPYFSVDVPALADWKLGVDVVADRTLRAKTTLFNGVASLQVRLFGTLADPRVMGQLKVEQGLVSLPFATFDVQIGVVRLTADDPFHPRIDVSATSRRNDYDLRMIASGPIDAPVLTFTSNPALPSDQILLLVMAGQAPQTGGLQGATTSQVAGIGAYLGQSLFSGISGSSADRLSIDSGEQISQKGKPTYEVEYRLGQRWWLVGEYDQFDDYNAGVKWRIYSGADRK